MIYQVTVKPGSKKGPLVLETNVGLTVYLRAKPIDGQANTELIQLLSDYFKVPKTSISIKTGARGRTKLVEIPNSMIQ